MKTLNKHDIITEQFIPEDRAKEILKVVNELEGVWIPRGTEEITMDIDEGHFFTLGRTSYLDGPHGATNISLEDLNPDVKSYNDIIEHRFLDLLVHTCEFLEDTFDLGHVYWDKDIATLPGFHVFKDIPKHALPEYHFDLHYKVLGFEGLEPDYDSVLSFTVPIELPVNSTGLETIDIHWSEVDGRDYNEFLLELAHGPARRKRYTQYSVGDMILHDGLTYHKISWADDDASGNRITFQGQLINTNRGWLLYW